ncbi:MAG: hypothetical protein L0338_39680 [Acidobacteria bacterium]|nr:hypothetical protein [Acidobacteriota bacterium]
MNKQIIFENEQQALEWARRVGGEQHRAVIVSLWDYTFHVERTYGSYTIPARSDNGTTVLDPEFTKSWGELAVGDAKEGMDIGDKRRITMRELAHDIAFDIVKNEDMEKFGVFVCRGAKPTFDELELARARIIAHFRFLIQDGDVKWAKPETRRDITDTHRKAVVQLAEKREWVYTFRQPLELANCPACGMEQKVEDPVICWNCKFPINREKALELGIIEEAQPAIVRGAKGQFQSVKKE